MVINPKNHMVKFHFLIKNFNLPKRSKLKEFVTKIFQAESKELDSLTYIFCSDLYLLELNNTFLKHNFFTDILTFDLSVSSDSIIGEIYISIDRVRDNAINLNETFSIELHRVIFHGALHLCGYKDKTKNDKTLMRSREDYYLKLYM